MSIKYFDEQEQAWKEIASTSANSITVLDIDNNYKSVTIEDCLKEIANEFNTTLVDITLTDGNLLNFFSKKELVKTVQLPTGGESVVYVGKEEPINSFEVWIDTTENEEIADDISNSLIDEFKEIFQFMKTRIEKLEKKILEQDARITYLELNGGGGSGGGGTDTENETLLFEDDFIMTFEDGFIMTLEEKDVPQQNTALIFETNEIMIFEDKYILTIE